MFPAAFDYRAPATLDEALGVLKERGDDAKVMAGGQSPPPLLKPRFAPPPPVPDLGRPPPVNPPARRRPPASPGPPPEPACAATELAARTQGRAVGTGAGGGGGGVGGRRVSRAGIGLTSVGPTKIKATQAEKALVGRELTDETIREAARLAAEAANPKDDIRGSAAYKKDVVRVFVQRGLHTALGRAQEVKA